MAKKREVKAALMGTRVRITMGCPLDYAAKEPQCHKNRLAARGTAESNCWRHYWRDATIVSDIWLDGDEPMVVVRVDCTGEVFPMFWCYLVALNQPGTTSDGLATREDCVVRGCYKLQEAALELQNGLKYPIGTGGEPALTARLTDGRLIAAHDAIRRVVETLQCYPMSKPANGLSGCKDAS